MAKLARYIHRLGLRFMDAGQLRSYTVLVATVTVVNMKVIPGHGVSENCRAEEKQSVP